MEWLSQNWVWVLFFIAFVAMHLFGHGGHGGHGGHRNPRGDGIGADTETNDSQPTGKDDPKNISRQGSGHQH